MAVGPLLGEGSVAALNRPGQKGRAVSPTGRCDGGVRELLWGLSGSLAAFHVECEPLPYLPAVQRLSV
ncbi:unnamed protein product [Rangifer tarandus platyrhynchus]|uniref:Uncharacterized protein n=1 Tax=Rangifer tarandus platyrhynchus TaxID=3082113 RepID=A0AC60A4I0_RANTA